ncbi:hypothetical protein GCM10023147_26240 [Tsukamurella soli]|uniref:Glyoxalase-like domain-containing protein n=1 Tax=Tsukamurella soli TaxID=644556 RepID=A0ABP8JQ93_9ACTN
MNVGITEITLLTNDVARTVAFWAAVFGVEPEDLGVDQWGRERWRITPANGPAVLVAPAPAYHFITRVDMHVTVDTGAADRLRAIGAEVSLPGWPLSAVDANGTDSDVHMTVQDPPDP